VRVIAGEFGGRTLQAPRGAVTRPTGDRVREALFSMLGDCDGDVLDLFAGSGALGIEALSRGARRALFVERDDRAADVIVANLSALGLGPDRAVLARQDVVAALRAARSRRATYDLLFIDPPYRDAQRWSAQLPALIEPLLAPGARLVAESDRRLPLALPGEELRRRRYGDTLIKVNRQP